MLAGPIVPVQIRQRAPIANPGLGREMPAAELTRALAKAALARLGQMAG
jgi:hypothetical protein